MSHDEREKEFEYAGPGSEDEAFMEPQQPRQYAAREPGRSRKTNRMYFLMIPVAIFILIGLGYCFLLSSNNAPLADVPGKQTSAPAMPKKNTQLITQESAAIPRADRTVRERFPELLEENGALAQAVQRTAAPPAYPDEAFKKEYIKVLTKISENTALIAVALKGEPPEPDPALVSSIEEMTGEIRQLAEENAGLRKANEELAVEIETLKAAALKNMAKKASVADSSSAKKTGKTGNSKSAAKDRTEFNIAGWRVIGLSANRVVIRDDTGKIHNLGVGDKLGNITIQAVDLKSGHVSTSAGPLAYGAAQ